MPDERHWRNPSGISTAAVAALVAMVSVQAYWPAGTRAAVPAMLQEKCAGRVPQVGVINAERPPVAVALSMVVPDMPAVIVREVGFAAAVKPGVATVSVMVAVEA